MEEAKLVYICSPYRSNTLDGIKTNIKDACKIARHLYLKNGYIPIVPHVNSQVIFGIKGGKNERIEEYDLRILAVCDAMFVNSKRGLSEGMQREIGFCKKNGIKILYEQYEYYLQ